MIFLTLVLTIWVQTTATPNPNATSLTISTPTAAIEIDAGKIKGNPHRLAWSPDATELYFQTMRRDRSGNPQIEHYILNIASRTVKGASQEPPWAAKYWAWKSAQAAPAASGVKIAVESKEQLVKSTATPMGGALARGDPGAAAGGSAAGSGLSVDEATAAANQMQKVTTYTLRLKGEELGVWTNEPVVPGLTFGWAPVRLGVVAFVNRSGRVVVMDPDGRKQELSSSQDALLPAWTDDGTRLGYLQTARKKLTLYIAAVAVR